MEMRAAAKILLVIAGLASEPCALAAPISMDVLVSLDGEVILSNVRVAMEDGKAASVEVDEALRVILTPTILAGGDIFIRAEMFMYQNGDFTNVANPTLQTREGEPTTVTITNDIGTKLELSVTPLLE